MRTVATLVKFQLRVLFRTPGYWVTAVVLSVLGITVFGLFLTDPTGPRLGVVDEAENEASARFLAAAESLERVDVAVGGREEQLDRLRDGERWAVVVLPPGFGSDPALSGVEIWTAEEGRFSTLTGAGIVRQLLTETVAGVDAAGIEVEVEPVGGDEPLRFIDIVVPGQVGLSLMFGNLFAAAMVGSWRQQGILRRMAASPTRPWHILASQIVVFGLVSAMQATVLLGLGRLLFGVTIEGSITALAAAIGVGIATFLTLWYALTAVVRSPMAANATASLLGFVMMFAGGSYLPLDDPPLLLKPLTAALPLTYLNEALRGVVNSGEGLSGIRTELGVLGVWAGVLFLVSMRAFRWTTED